MKKAQVYVKASETFTAKGVPLDQQRLLFQQLRGTGLDKATKLGVQKWESRPPEVSAEGEIIVPNALQGLLWIVEGIPEPRGVAQRLISLYIYQNIFIAG